MKKNIFLFVLALFALEAAGQTDRQYIRSGNRFYRQQNFEKAEAEYLKAIAKNGNNPQALYNLGCALMMQQKHNDALKYYAKAADVENSKLRKARIYHNVGVILQGGKQYDDAIEAYKESLRNNPVDNETRYNLALCKKLRKNSNQKKNENKEDHKNKQDDEKQQKEKDKQDKPQQKKNESMSKENAEQLLNAAMQAEKNTKQRVDDATRHQKSRTLDKNW